MMAAHDENAVMVYLGPLLTGEPVDQPIVRQIPPHWLRFFWPQLLPDFERVVERVRGRWTLETIAKQIINGDWQLWLVWDGTLKAAVATELYHEDSGMKAARAVFVAGSEMKSWAHLITDLEDWARQNGAQRFDMIIAKGLARHFPEYRMSHVLLEKDLADGL